MPGSTPAPAHAESPSPAAAGLTPSLILSFDIEEHHRIEAAVAADLQFPVGLRDYYGDRMEWATRKLLDRLAQTGTLATFYIVGEIAKSHPKLVFDIAYAGHEIGAHSWDHRRVNRFDARGFADDLINTRDALQQSSGFPVYGFRAPTFSITRDTAWALDTLAECGFAYDSSIYPVRHDRYGVPDAPRGPFLAVGPHGGTMLELPPVTYRMFGQNLPVGGGGYFRLFPLWVTRRSIQQMMMTTNPAVAMLYLHPWEFDPGQPKLPLPFVSKWRTYVGVRKCFEKLNALLNTFTFRRAMDVVTDLHEIRNQLPRFELGSTATVISTRVKVESRVETAT